MIKITFCLTRLPTLSRAEFQHYWRNSHANLVRSHARVLGIRRYVQAHTVSDAASLDLALVRNSAGQDYDGVAMLWWDDMAALTAASATEAGRQAGAELLADERTFIDLPKSPIFLSEEFAVWDV